MHPDREKVFGILIEAMATWKITTFAEQRSTDLFTLADRLSDYLAPFFDGARPKGQDVVDVVVSNMRQFEKGKSVPQDVRVLEMWSLVDALITYFEVRYTRTEWPDVPVDPIVSACRAALWPNGKPQAFGG